jgi:hypothetical protein
LINSRIKDKINALTAAFERGDRQMSKKTRKIISAIIVVILALAMIVSLAVVSIGH